MRYLSPDSNDHLADLEAAGSVTGLVNCKEQIAQLTDRKRPAKALFDERLRLAKMLYYCNSTPARKMQSRLEQCGSAIAVFGHKRVLETHMCVTMWCNARFCPVCAPVSVFQTAKRFTYAMAHSVHKPLKFATFTVRNVPIGSLDRAMVGLSSAWLRFSKDHLARHYRSAGYIQKREVTYNRKTREWHPHLHCIIDSDFIPAKELTRRWNKCAEKAGFSVSDASTQISAVRTDDTAKAAYECAVYCSKPVAANAANAYFWDLLISAWYGQRAYSSAGSLRLRPLPKSGDWEFVDFLDRYLRVCSDDVADSLIDLIPLRNDFETLAAQSQWPKLVQAVEKRIAHTHNTRIRKA